MVHAGSRERKGVNDTLTYESLHFSASHYIKHVMCEQNALTELL